MLLCVFLMSLWYECFINKNNKTRRKRWTQMQAVFTFADNQLGELTHSNNQIQWIIIQCHPKASNKPYHVAHQNWPAAENTVSSINHIQIAANIKYNEKVKKETILLLETVVFTLKPQMTTRCFDEVRSHLWVQSWQPLQNLWQTRFQRVKKQLCWFHYVS